MNIEETKKAIEVMQAYVDGAEIEFNMRGSHHSKLLGEPVWNWNDFEYRVALPKFDMWDELPRKYKWVAMNADGGVFACQQKPEKGGKIWIPKDSNFLQINNGWYNFPKVKWGESLVEYKGE